MFYSYPVGTASCPHSTHPPTPARPSPRPLSTRLDGLGSLMKSSARADGQWWVATNQPEVTHDGIANSVAQLLKSNKTETNESGRILQNHGQMERT